MESKAKDTTPKSHPQQSCGSSDKDTSQKCDNNNMKHLTKAERIQRHLAGSDQPSSCSAIDKTVPDGVCERNTDVGGGECGAQPKESRVSISPKDDVVYHYVPPQSPSVATQTTPSIEHRPLICDDQPRSPVDVVSFTLDVAETTDGPSGDDPTEVLPEPRRSRSRSLPEAPFMHMRYVHFGRQLRFAGDEFSRIKLAESSLERPSSFPRVRVAGRGKMRLQGSIVELSESQEVRGEHEEATGGDGDKELGSSWSSTSLYDVWCKLWQMHTENAAASKESVEEISSDDDVDSKGNLGNDDDESKENLGDDDDIERHFDMELDS